MGNEKGVKQVWYMELNLKFRKITKNRKNQIYVMIDSYPNIVLKS